MRRLQLIEIHEQAWCPLSIRNAATDYLELAADVADVYGGIVPQLRRALARSGTLEVLDLCSGGGGPWPRLLGRLDARVTRVRLTDQHPNRDAARRARARGDARIEYVGTPVDAMRVPMHLDGFRTLFTAFHHFPPERARGILQAAVRRGCGIGVFEVSERHPRALLTMVLAPLFVLLGTPWIRPFRWSRLFWTYLVPAVPLIALFDGIVSCLRSYTPAELEAMVGDLDGPPHDWEIGQQRSPLRPQAVTYLIGVPVRSAEGPVDARP